MKKIVFAIICMFLIISSPISTSAAIGIPEDVGLPNLQEDERNLGEALIINVDHYEPTIIRSDYFKDNDFEAYVFLKGSTLGTFLFGDNAPENAPFFGDLKIKNIRLTTDRESARYVAGISQIKRPKGKELVVDSTGNVDLGYTKVRFRRQPNEAELPKESIEIDVTAQIYFDVTTGFGQFGTYSLNLAPAPDESTWLNSGTQEGEIWGGRAYLRLVNIQGKTANLQVYDSQKRKITSIQLSEGAGAKQVNLPGGVKFLENLLSLNLERISTDTDKARLIIDNKGKVFETTVVKGMRPFPGSNWVVEEIFSDNVVFMDEEGNQKVLRRPGFGELLANRTFSPQRAPEENVFETNPILSKLEKIEPDLYIMKGGWFTQGHLNTGDLYYKHIGSGIWKWSPDKKYWMPTTTYKAEGRSWYQGNDMSGANKEIIDELQRLKPEPPRDFQEESENQELNTNSEWHIETGVPESVKFYDQAIDEYEEAIFSNPSDYSLIYDSYLGMAKAYDKIGIYSKEDILKAIEAYQKAESYKEYNEGEEFNFEAKYAELNQRLADGLGTVDLGDGIHVSLLEITSGEEKKNNVIYSVNGLEKPPVNSGDPLDLGAEVVDEYANKYNWIVEGLNPDNIVIRQKFLNPSSTNGLQERTRTLKLGQNNPVPYNGQKTRDVYIKKIDITSSAIITVSPGTKNNYGTSYFTIHLPIEQRLIQWTPEEIDKKIAATDKAIQKLDGIITKLGNVVKTWKTVCFSVFAFLTLKNAFFTNPTGRRLAVERMEKDCSAKVQDITSEFSGMEIEDCIKGRKAELDTWVESSKAAVKETEDLFKDFKWDDDAAVEKVAAEIDGVSASELRTMQEYGYISAKDLRDAIHSSKSGAGWGEDATTRISDIKRSSENAAQVKSALSEVDEYEDMTPREKRSQIDEIRAAVDKTVERESIDSHLDEQDAATKAFLRERYEGKEVTRNLPIYEEIASGEDDSYYTYLVGADGKTQKVKLEPIKRSSTEILRSSQGDYYQDDSGNVYLSSRVVNDHSREYRGGAQVFYDETNKNRPMYIPLYYDPAQYGNSCSEIPKIVDFANYVEVYVDERGKYHYTIINVGQDGRLDVGQDGEVLSGGDDRVIVHSSLLDPENPTARSGCYAQLARDIQAAYRDADKGPRNGNEVTIRGQTYLAGKIATKTKSIMTECTYIMPETDCKILFGVCDPVMCPVSRFNLGGNWKIGASVVETGIIGSIILGLPNFNIPYEPVPICLTGIHAGLENIQSMLGSFRDCLETAKVKGEPVGICNEIRSVYMCDILWHEALALVDIFGSLRQWIASNIFGAGSSGAVDVSWQSSWDQLSDNVDFFTKEYARSAFAAFHSRSTNEIGSEICKAAIFGQYPGGGDLLAQLTEPESPPQFTGWFEEDLYTAVDPETIADLGESGFAQGQSAYRIYYHIYAGRNTDVRYNVYLKDAVGNVMPATDPRGFSLGGQRFIRKGETVDQSFVLTARPPGFNEMCISINGRESCGFGSVSSAFSMNYLKDQLIKSEIEKKNIDSADKCIPDEPHYKPGFIQHGVKRVCSVYDPDGVGDDWALVGTCGYDERDRFLGDCYLFARDIDLYDLSYNTTGKLYNASKELLANRTLVDDEDIKRAREELERIKLEEEAAEDRSEFIDDYEKIARWDIDDDITAESHYRIAEIYVWMAGQRAKKETTTNDATKNATCIISYDDDTKLFQNIVQFKFEEGIWKYNIDWSKGGKMYANWRPITQGPTGFDHKFFVDLIKKLKKAKTFEVGVKLIVEQANGEEYNDDKIKVIVDEMELYKPGHGNAVAGEVLKYCGVEGADISFSDLASLMEYLRSHSVENRICDCKDSCGDYAKWITKYSKEHDIDPILTLSVMMHESACVANACGNDGKCSGLMQVTESTANQVCGVSDIEKNLFGDKNAEANIECGVKVLRDKYDSYKDGGRPTQTDKCKQENIDKYKAYRGWQAALRGYNGWSCNEIYNTEYVEEAWARYQQLKSMLGDQVSLIQEQTITEETTLLARLGTPDSNGIYTYDVGDGVSDLYYRHTGDGNWEWSPDKQNWMSTSTTTVSGGKWDGQTPNIKNVEIINNLETLKPTPTNSQIKINIPEKGCEKEDEKTCDNFNGCYLKLNKGMFGWDWASGDDCKDCTKLEKCQDIKNSQKCGENLCAGLAGKSCEWDYTKNLCIEGTPKFKVQTNTDQIEEVVESAIEVQRALVETVGEPIELEEEPPDYIDITDALKNYSDSLSDLSIRDSLVTKSELLLDDFEFRVSRSTIDEETKTQIQERLEEQPVEEPKSEQEKIETNIESTLRLYDLLVKRTKLETDQAIEDYQQKAIDDIAFKAKILSDSENEIQCLEDVDLELKYTAEDYLESLEAHVETSDLPQPAKDQITGQIEEQTVCDAEIENPSPITKVAEEFLDVEREMIMMLEDEEIDEDIDYIDLTEVLRDMYYSTRDLDVPEPIWEDSEELFNDFRTSISETPMSAETRVEVDEALRVPPPIVPEEETMEQYLERTLGLTQEMVDQLKKQADRTSPNLNKYTEDIIEMNARAKILSDAANRVQCLPEATSELKYGFEEALRDLETHIESSDISLEDEQQITAQIEESPVCELPSPTGECSALNIPSDTQGKLYGCHAQGECRGDYMEGQLDCAQGESCCRPTCEAAYPDRECVDTDYYQCLNEPARNYCVGDSSVVCCEKGDKISYSNSVDKRLQQMIDGDITYIEKMSCSFEEGDYCAKFVKTAFEYAFGYGRHYLTGTGGNAWDFPKHIENRGGDVEWFDWRKGETFNAYDSLNPGDIIGFYYSGSDYLPEKKGGGLGNTKKIDFTHVTLYLGERNGKHYITHLYHVPSRISSNGEDPLRYEYDLAGIRIEPLEDFLRLYGEYFKIRTIMRPDREKAYQRVLSYETEEYIVKEQDVLAAEMGDTIINIADKNKRRSDNVEEFAWLISEYNAIADSSSIKVGDIIQLPLTNRELEYTNEDPMYLAIKNALQKRNVSSSWARPIYAQASYKTPEYIGLLMAIIQKESSFTEKFGLGDLGKEGGIKEVWAQINSQVLGSESNSLGCMQVQVKRAVEINDEQGWGFDSGTIKDQLLTKDGCVKWGVAYLDKIIKIYAGDPPQLTTENMRFILADYNSGYYDSRNAAYQQRVSQLSGRELTLDGDLWNQKDINLKELSQTELAIKVIFPSLSTNEIRRQTIKEDNKDFENTYIYLEVSKLWKNRFGENKFKYAIVPEISKYGGLGSVKSYIKDLEGYYNFFCEPLACTVKFDENTG